MNGREARRWTLPELHISQGHLILVVTGVGFLLRLYRLDAQGLWFDEAYTAAIAGLPLGDSLRALIADGVHPPGFYLLERLFLPIGTPEIWLRVPSVLLGSAAIPLVYLLGNVWLGPRAGISAAMLMALSPFQIWYSQEARMYAPLGMLSLLCMYLYDRFLERPSREIYGGFVLASAAAYFTHYFALFLPLVQFTHLAGNLRRHWRSLRSWTALQAVAALPLVIWIGAIANRDAQFFGIGWIPIPALLDLPLTLMNFTTGVPAEIPSLSYGVLLLAFSAIILAWRREWAIADRKSLAFLWCFLPPLASFLFSLRRPVYIDRFLILSSGAWLLLVGAGLAGQKRRWFLIGIAILLIALLSGASRLNWGGTQVKEAWREAGGVLSSAEADEVIVPRVFQTAIPLGQYYSGPASIEPLEINRETRQLSDIARGHAGLWLVYWNVSAEAHLFASSPPFDPDVEENPEVRRWLEGAGPELTSREDLPGVTVFHFVLDQE